MTPRLVECRCRSCAASPWHRIWMGIVSTITTAGFDVFEKHFGYPYPFGKYDQVFVPSTTAAPWRTSAAW